MEIEYHTKYLRQYKKLTPKQQKQTDQIEEIIRMSDNFEKLFQQLDIKKFVKDLGGYRIRYGNNPELRIRFDYNKETKKIELFMVMTREDFNNFTTKSLNEESDKKTKILITERQLLLLKKIQL